MAAAWGYPVLVQKFVSGEEVNLTAVGDGSGAMIGEVMMKKQAITDKGKAWALHPVHLTGADRRPANDASYEPATGRFVIPPRSAVVYVVN